MGSAKDTRRVVTDEDASRISRVEELSYELKIEQVMTADVQTVTPDMQIIEVLDLFRQLRISGAPVLDHDRAGGPDQPRRFDPRAAARQRSRAGARIHDDDPGDGAFV